MHRICQGLQLGDDIGGKRERLLRKLDHLVQLQRILHGIGIDLIRGDGRFYRCGRQDHLPVRHGFKRTDERTGSSHDHGIRTRETGAYQSPALSLQRGMGSGRGRTVFRVQHRGHFLFDYGRMEHSPVAMPVQAGERHIMGSVRRRTVYKHAIHSRKRRSFPELHILRSFPHRGRIWRHGLRLRTAHGGIRHVLQARRKRRGHWKGMRKRQRAGSSPGLGGVRRRAGHPHQLTDLERKHSGVGVDTGRGRKRDKRSIQQRHRREHGHPQERSERNG